MMLPADLQLPRARTPITYSKLLIVEGHDAFQFFKALLRHLNLLEKIEIRNFGGVNDLAKYLDLLTDLPGFAAVTSVGIVRDAEKDATQAFASVCRDLKQTGLSVPDRPAVIAGETPQVSVFILPDGINPGMLETLCLQSVSNDPATPCVEEFFLCVQRQGLALPRNVRKARLHTFLASRPRPGLLLGQAAHAGYWPWNSPAFDPLKQFLRAL